MSFFHVFPHTTSLEKNRMTEKITIKITIIAANRGRNRSRASFADEICAIDSVSTKNWERTLNSYYFHIENFL